MDEEVMIFLLLTLLTIGLVLSPVVSLCFIIGIKRRLKRLHDDHDKVSHKVDRLTAAIEKTPVRSSVEVKAQPPKPAVVAQKAPVQKKVEVAPPVHGKPAPPRKALFPSVDASARLKKVAARVAPVLSESKPSKVVESVREVLASMWNWILVGEQHRPKNVSAEYAIASTWLLRVSIVALVTGVVFFLKWSVDQNLIGPAGRVAVAIAFGVGMLILGMRLLDKKYHLIGQGLLGGGILTLYFSVFAMGPMYELVSTPIAYSLMVVVTVAAGIMSVSVNSMLSAILGIAGGYMTPVLLPAGDLGLSALYGYMLILSVGILGVARARNWRLLNYLGFIATYVLFYRSLNVYTVSDFPVAVSFLAAFFVIHSATVYVYNILRGKTSTTLEVIHLVANAVMLAWAGYWLISGAYGRPYPSIMSLAVAVFYMCHILMFLNRKLIDRKLLVTLIALAGAFTTWTLPLVLEKESLTISLSLLAFMFLWLGRKMQSNFIQQLGYLVYLAIFYRLAFLDLPRNFGLMYGEEVPASEYWRQMLQRLWTFGTSIGSVLAAFILQRKESLPEEDLAVPPANDVGTSVDRKFGSSTFFWAGLLLAFAFVHLELNSMFMYCAPLRLPVLSVLWCGMAAWLLWRFVDGKCADTGLFAVGSIFLIVALIKLISFDLAAWGFCGRFIYQMEYSLAYAGARLLDYGVIMALLFTVWWWLSSSADFKELNPSSSRKVTLLFGYSGLVLFFMYATLELNSLLYWCLTDFQEGGVSILWAIFAICFICAGIWKGVRALRYIGLVLFCIVVGKVFLVDLSDMEMIYRVIAFMVVGVALMLGAFAYIHSSRKFESGTESSEGQEK
ncbi:MAG: DUF2339 domain-containing protein [Kiritimatiellia bacterium]|jgi:uncharacterized membrane protein|nr:DUF2339 domain-containing protein [Kiritimatiellia bacterium]MDP6848589.1 DUF2339 domain-containing protein [Kiritimatiellia bacterium]